MKGNNGKGNIPDRDLWETKQELWDKLHEQYNFSIDCCASKKNKKCNRYFEKFEEGDYEIIAMKGTWKIVGEDK